MLDIFFNNLLAVIGTLFATAFIMMMKGLKTRLDSILNLFEKIKDGVVGLLKYRLYYNCQYYLRIHCIPIDELSELEVLYKKYENLGGNGKCKSLLEQVRTLEVVTVEEFEKRKYRDIFRKGGKHES